MSRLLIAASGTGGHIFPALAVAYALPKSWRIDWLGVNNRLESKLIQREFDLHTIHLEGLQNNIFKRLTNAKIGV